MGLERIEAEELRAKEGKTSQSSRGDRSIFCLLVLYVMPSRNLSSHSSPLAKTPPKLSVCHFSAVTVSCQLLLLVSRVVLFLLKSDAL